MLTVWNVRGTLYLMRQCECCGELRRLKTINLNYNEPALDKQRAIKVVEQRILDAHASVTKVIEPDVILWAVGPTVKLAGFGPGTVNNGKV